MGFEKTARGKRPHFFDDPAVDHVVSMLLELMSEHWVLRERLYVLEKLLAEQTGLDLERLEEYQLSAEQGAELEAQRRHLIESVMLSLHAEQENIARRQRRIDVGIDRDEIQE